MAKPYYGYAKSPAEIKKTQDYWRNRIRQTYRSMKPSYQYKQNIDLPESVYARNKRLADQAEFRRSRELENRWLKVNNYVVIGDRLVKMPKQKIKSPVDEYMYFGKEGRIFPKRDYGSAANIAERKRIAQQKLIARKKAFEASYEASLKRRKRIAQQKLTATKRKYASKQKFQSKFGSGGYIESCKKCEAIGGCCLHDGSCGCLDCAHCQMQNY